MGEYEETRFERALQSFEKAVREHSELGSIPLIGGDEREQKAINAERKRIKSNYTRSRRRVLRLYKGA